MNERGDGMDGPHIHRGRTEEEVDPTLINTKISLEAPTNSNTGH